ncbi:hypothetical protein BVC80_1157g15 [Macleaya cordata]|uniref:Uncharacterized protein n=1 Tax=Macleaya cordata TaxID=56857 RepID=A0A200QR87_MACCD|nr:hypothetical protein BVC80_1157g15 [Macleaya cordata]
MESTRAVVLKERECPAVLPDSCYVVPFYSVGSVGPNLFGFVLLLPLSHLTRQISTVLTDPPEGIMHGYPLSECRCWRWLLTSISHSSQAEDTGVPSEDHWT